MKRGLVAPVYRSIGFLLLTLVASVIVPLIGLFSWQAIEAAGEKRAAIEEKRAEVAKIISMRVDVEVSRYFGALQALGSLVDNTDTGESNLSGLTKRLKPDPNIVNVWPLANPQTSAKICNESQECPLVNQFIARAAQEHRTVSDVWEASPGDARVLIATPQQDGESPRTGLVMELRVDFISRTAFRDSGLGQDWVVGVVDRKNNFVARSLQPELRLGRPARPELGIAATGRERDGTFENVTLEGVDMVNSFHRSSLTGWTTVAAVPKSVLVSPLRASVILALSVSGVILALTIALVVQQARRIAEPIRDLSDYALALSEGRPFVGGRFQIAEFDAVRSTMEKTMSNSARLAAVAATSGDAILTVSLAGTVLSWNRAAEEMFGYKQDEIIGRSKLMILPPTTHHELHAERERGLKGESVSYESVRRHRDGSLIDVAITSAPIYGPGGGVVAISSILRDIRKRKSDERHILDLMRELAHRSKNQIAIIQSIAKKTAMSADSLEEFSDEFASRLQGLAITFDVLSKREWKVANVRELVDQQLGVFVDGRSLQLRAEGPDVELGSSYIEALGLALHELATNAVKYGAWSNHTGVVHVHWSRMPAPPSEPQTADDFELVWREEGGPRVFAPRRTGFGSVILDTVVSRSVRGISKFEYAAEGIRWTVGFQLEPQ